MENWSSAFIEPRKKQPSGGNNWPSDVAPTHVSLPQLWMHRASRKCEVFFCALVPYYGVRMVGI